MPVVLACSVKLVEQELWQREDKGLIGVLPVRDSEAAAVGSILSSGEIELVGSNSANEPFVGIVDLHFF